MADDKKNEGADKKKKPDLKALMLFGFMGVNLALVSLGAYLTYASTLGWHAPKITEEDLASKAEMEKNELHVPLLYTMDKFTVNLSGEPARMIRLEVNLEMLSKDGFEEVMNPDVKTRARDKILQILNNKNYSEIESIQGKLFLKDQITSEINNLLYQGVVKEVFFSDFIVQ